LAQRLFPDRQVRLAFSAGAPEPARNRKPSFLVCDLSGELLAFGKVSAGPLSQRLMEHEAQMVERLHAAMTEAPAPRLLFAGAIGETFITLQRPLGGRTPRAQLTPSHMRLLERLRIGPMKPAACVAMVATLPARLAALPSPQPLLIDAMEKVLPVLRDTIVPSTIVHGDFAPWNLRELHGEVRAFDWEYGEIDGLPLVDQMHFTLQTGFILRNWKSADALQSLGQLEMSKPLGLAPRQVRAIQIVYLVDNLVRLYSEGYGDCDDVVMWYRDLLPQLLARETVAG
jgi:hypothetical protein